MGVINISKLLIGSPTVQGMFYVTNEIYVLVQEAYQSQSFVPPFLN